MTICWSELREMNLLPNKKFFQTWMTTFFFFVALLTLFRMGFFGAGHGWGDQKGLPSLKPVTHILQWWNVAVIPYLKKIQKLYESHDTPLEFCWHQHLLPEISNFFISRNTDIDPFRYMVYNSSNFSRVFNDCFNKHVHNFDDVSKNGYLRPS